MAENETKPAAPAVATQNQNEAANRRANQDRRARERAHSDASQKLEDEAAERHKANLDAEERRNNSQPTPTQRENDLAKLGHDVSDKEDDGSGPEQPIAGRRGGAYLTRDVTK